MKRIVILGVVTCLDMSDEIAKTLDNICSVDKSFDVGDNCYKEEGNFYNDVEPRVYNNKRGSCGKNLPLGFDYYCRR